MKQQEQINRTLGSCHFLFNQMLAERKKVYDELKEDKRKLYEYEYKSEKDYKKEFEWLNEVDSTALQQSRINLSNAYSNFFKSLKGKRKSVTGFPKFKKKKMGCSYRSPQNGGFIKIDFENSKVKLPKLGWINFRDGNRKYEGRIINATVSRSSSGKYFVSVLYEVETDVKQSEIPNPKIKGLDMSMDCFYVDELGNSPDFKRQFRVTEKQLAKQQKILSRKKKGSNNFRRQCLKVARVHEKISNRRKDFTQKFSTKLVEENDMIVVENLSLKGMSQALNLGKSVMDLGYSNFINQLEYKTQWVGKKLVKANKWFASSKTCSFCGFVKKDLMLHEREWDCPNCGEHLHRDKNAAINLCKIGKGLPESTLVERQTAVELTLASLKSHTSLKQESLPLGRVAQKIIN